MGTATFWTDSTAVESLQCPLGVATYLGWVTSSRRSNGDLSTWPLEVKGTLNEETGGGKVSSNLDSADTEDEETSKKAYVGAASLL